MAKKVMALITLQIPAGQANPAPPVGTALGPHGINIMDFCKAYNAQTQDKAGQIIPARITIFEDRSFNFVLKTPPVSDLLRKAAGVEKGSPSQKLGQLHISQQHSYPRRRRDGLLRRFWLSDLEKLHVYKQRGR